MTLQFFLQNAWRKMCNIPEKEWGIDTKDLEKTEWSTKFELLMRNRLIQGALRYGRLHEKGKPKWNRNAAIGMKLLEYRKTKNKECLVDIANYCLLEFEEGDGVFISTDDKNHCEG